MTVLHNCDTCDWYCYGTYPENTCDRWERTIAVIDIDEDTLAQLMNQPTSGDLNDLKREIAELEQEINDHGQSQQG